VKLIAEWTTSQDTSVEHPRSVRWEDGRTATLDDYIKHSVDTHVFCEDYPDRIELHMFPDIVADVTYDKFAGSWVVKDAGFGGWSLDIADPEAKYDELIAAVATFPVVYRARIRR
jgi:hypothetical protein